MNWINWFGLGIVLLLLIPNAVYAAANKNTQPPRTSRILGLAEQAGRYGCMFLMIFHAGLTEFGFASAEGFIAWLAGTYRWCRSTARTLPAPRPWASAA